MKKTLLIAALFLGTVTGVTAQQPLKQGVIKYDMKIELRKQVAKKNPALASMVPEEMHMTSTLTFRDHKYALVTNEESAEAKAQPNTTLKASGGNQKQYIDLKTGICRTDYARGTKKYYAEQKMTGTAKIKPTNETKQILGYTCKKAIVTNGDKTVEIWYTEAIPYCYSTDVSLYNSVKGAILEISTDEYVYRAVSISDKAFAANAMTPDATARKISSEQLQDLVEENTAATAESVKTDKKGNKVMTKSISIKL